MGERQLHVALDRDRPFLAIIALISSPSALMSASGGRFRTLQPISPRPMTISGADKIIPIVRPPPRSSRRGSGSRKNSQKMRATP